MEKTLAPLESAPATVRAHSLGSIKVEPLTCTIGAELCGVHLGDAARDEDLFAEIKALLLQYKVLFLRDQDITRAEHVAFAERFGALEDHPVAGSDPDHPGLVRHQFEAAEPECVDATGERERLRVGQVHGGRGGSVLERAQQRPDQLPAGEPPRAGRT